MHEDLVKYLYCTQTSQQPKFSRSLYKKNKHMVPLK